MPNPPPIRLRPCLSCPVLNSTQLFCCILLNHLVTVVYCPCLPCRIWIQIMFLRCRMVYLLCKLILMVSYYVSSYCRFILVSLIRFNFLHTILFPSNRSSPGDLFTSDVQLCVMCCVFIHAFYQLFIC